MTINRSSFNTESGLQSLNPATAKWIVTRLKTQNASIREAFKQVQQSMDRLSKEDPNGAVFRVELLAVNRDGKIYFLPSESKIHFTQEQKELFQRLVSSCNQLMSALGPPPTEIPLNVGHWFAGLCRSAEFVLWINQGVCCLFSSNL